MVHRVKASLLGLRLPPQVAPVSRTPYYGIAEANFSALPANITPSLLEHFGFLAMLNSVYAGCYYTCVAKTGNWMGCGDKCAFLRFG